MLHQTNGKILQQRYKIVQNLGSGLFGQNYLAEDLRAPLHARCVIKCLKVSSEPNHLKVTRLRFATEIEKLRSLEKHNGICQIIAAFEEDGQFYLVQELIKGHTLTAELPIDENWGNLWNESEVVKFLQEILGILEFVHSSGIVHCDLKPDNLIRRSSDGRLFITDFGSLGVSEFEVNPSLPIFRLPISSLGYTPPEQFNRQVHPNMDIYALGLIAIQGLTRLSPMQLKRDQETNNIIWRLNEIEVSDQIAAVLSKMICHDFQERYQSAREVIQALQNLCIEADYTKVESYSSHKIQILDLPHQESGRFHYLNQKIDLDPQEKYLSHQALKSASKFNQKAIIPEHSQSSAVLTGMKLSLTANALFIGFGTYSLLNHPVASSETSTLSKARLEYQAGDLDKAIALAKSIPPESSIYLEAQDTIKDWDKEWKIAAQQYQVAEIAFNQSRWADVLIASRKEINISYWQAKTDHLVKQAKNKIEIVAQQQLNKSYSAANVKDFSTALSYLQQIPPESSLGKIVKQKLAEYSQKQHVKAVHLLQLAYNKAEAKDFSTAIRIIKQIPKETPSYATAQLKKAEYSLKYRQQLQIPKDELKSNISSLDAANHLQPVNIP